MKKENIIKAAERANLDNYTSRLFVRFFEMRFPNESDMITSYVDHWAERFKSGTPEVYMDSSSKEYYEKILSKELLVQ